jgi:hypothetical protein
MGSDTSELLLNTADKLATLDRSEKLLFKVIGDTVLAIKGYHTEQ